MISRRSLILSAGTMAVGAAAASEAPTGGKWQAGSHYLVLDTPQATLSKPGKVEVIEFFWFGCPHCYTLQPHLQLWDKRRTDDVDFVKVPATWKADVIPHAKLHYALQALERDDLHSLVFDTIHHGSKRQPQSKLETFDQQLEFVTRNGVDKQAFTAAFNAPSMEANLARAEKLFKAYRVLYTPSMAVNGKYTSDLSRVASEQQLMSVVRQLVKSERRT